VKDKISTPKNHLIFEIYLQIFSMLSGSNISKFPLVRKISEKIISAYHPDSTIIDGLKFTMDSKDSMKFSIRKNYPKVNLHYLQVIKKGDIVIDVGANIGYFTLLFARLVGETGKVIAIEPDPSNFKLLEKNIHDNNFKNIITLQNAVSNNEDIVSLIQGETIGEHKISNETHDESVKVKCMKLDDYCTRFKKIKLLKSDTEGNEVSVLNGCEKLLKEEKIENIMIEFNPHHLMNYGFDHPKILCDILSENGYKIMDVENEILDQEVDYNYLMEKHGKIGGTDLFCSRMN